MQINFTEFARAAVYTLKCYSISIGYMIRIGFVQ